MFYSVGKTEEINIHVLLYCKKQRIKYSCNMYCKVADVIPTH